MQSSNLEKPLQTYTKQDSAAESSANIALALNATRLRNILETQSTASSLAPAFLAEGLSFNELSEKKSLFPRTQRMD